MQNSLELMRKEIDAIDTELLHLFEKRMNVVSQIADYKQEHGLDVQNTQREMEIIASIKNCVSADYVTPATDFVTEILRISRNFQHTRHSKMY